MVDIYSDSSVWYKYENHLKKKKRYFVCIYLLNHTYWDSCYMFPSNKNHICHGNYYLQTFHYLMISSVTILLYRDAVWHGSEAADPMGTARLQCYMTLLNKPPFLVTGLASEHRNNVDFCHCTRDEYVRCKWRIMRFVVRIFIGYYHHLNCIYSNGIATCVHAQVPYLKYRRVRSQPMRNNVAYLVCFHTGPDLTRPWKMSPNILRFSAECIQYSRYYLNRI